MASGILVDIKEEVTCPICLELLTEPLSLDCGHSFCQVCITTNNKESMISQEGESSCPVCRITYQPRNLRPNRHVANIVKRLREVKLSQEEDQKRDLCVCHEEKLLLFCKEDGKVICWLCERAQEHRGHHTLLMKEVAQEYQEKLQATLERLRKDQQEAEELEADIREEITSWKNQIQNETKRVQAEFNQMRSMLDCEEHEELLKLKNEEGDILHNLAESENELVQQSQLVRAVLSDVEHRLQGSTMEMLQDVNGIMERSETLTLKKPKTIPMEQRRVFRAPDLRGILRMFTEFTDVQRYWVHMTLDPPKDKSDVFISADRRQVRYEFSRKFNTNIYRNGDYDDYGVLGSPVIRSGKHYWEVDVSGKHTWILGVYSGKCPEINMKAFFRQGENYQHVYSRYQPRNGYWVIGLQNHFEYNAFEKSSSSDPLILTLYLTVRPLRIGIFLDYEAGTVSFFNVTYHGFLIYKFSSCHFSRDIFPYFNPMKCSAPITLCSPSS
ncbi:PREDICTED: tripartite motif-containing protein 5-like [Ceratotherium simum simum]|uniref:Tripartite motif-containing protein 5-like n=1 Tax=Ceratotherium simum simum TaxID=73337 RepID=A0ABM0H2S9_CERSS|nr:PREDICTED: tripartite motif-containing protein 5-like [Ceratotherium simum simum]